MNYLYLHWVCIDPPTCTHLKVGLSTDIEKRKRSYYADGWKDKDSGFLSIREIPETYDLEALELALQIYFYLKSGEKLLTNDPSRITLEIFPYYDRAKEDFDGLDISKVFSDIGESVFRLLGEGAKCDWGVKKKIKTRLYKITKESILESLLLEIGGKEWDEDLLYDLWPISNIECNLAYREIICWGIGLGKLGRLYENKRIIKL